MGRRSRRKRTTDRQAQYGADGQGNLGLARDHGWLQLVVPSYSPRTGLLYVMAYDGETKYFVRPVEYEQGESFRGVAERHPCPPTHTSPR